MKLISLIKEEKGSIRDLMYSFVIANNNESLRDRDKWLGMIVPRLISLGFQRKQRNAIVASLNNVANEKQLDKLVAQYKLFGDYAKSFKAIESSLASALKEAEDEVSSADVSSSEKKFKLVLQIPSTTSADKDQKIRKLKFDFSLNDIKIEALQPVNVAVLAQDVIDFQVVVYISTTLTRSEITNVLEPDYVINKMQLLKK